MPVPAYFYPRSPCGERRAPSITPAPSRNFYPRSPCGERHAKRFSALHNIFISIHALLAESDSQQPRGTTRTTYFYPRSPCGERLHRAVNIQRPTAFLSTLSLRRATHYDNYNLHCTEISIHALLAESDHNGRVDLLRFQNFYPRSPCGERQYPTEYRWQNQRQFLSTLSLRRATFGCWTALNRPSRFLSTLSLRRATEDANDSSNANLHFYPRSPCGERLVPSVLHFQPLQISIHALLAESDHNLNLPSSPMERFLSTLSLRRATS